MQWIRAFLHYFGEQQNPSVRVVHIFVLLLVIIQIVISNFMRVPKEVVVGMHGVNAVFSWLHMGVGLVLLCLTVVLAARCFRARGLRYYYPYFLGDFAQLHSDIGALRSCRLPKAEAGGLAACVQGLGLGAMGLVVLSGTAWLVL